ncbi:MAG: UbiX family flavin prenyltransferase [Syntrophaceae bacterium]|nr:UbiX family flavin prenyltransferase [Syntrophaceae bacterium]
MKKIVVGITGASGALYAVKLISVLRKNPVESHVVISEMGVQVLEHELRINRKEIPLILTGSQESDETPGKTIIHDVRDMFAPVASGSFQTNGMVIIPCSMKTLSAVANGYTTNLLERAADVALKEKLPLILLTRESPLGRVHMINMLKAHEAGAVIMPACPGFYYHPETIDDLANFVVSRVLDHLKIDYPNPLRWKSE